MIPRHSFGEGQGVDRVAGAVLHSHVALMGSRTDAVREAIARCHASQAELAREAGVPTSTLSRIAANKLGASEDVAQAVASALERWSGESSDLAARIRATFMEEDS